MMIYHSLVESRLRYGILGWSTASNHQLDRLKTLQNRALRYIDFSPICTTILPIYAQFKVLPLNRIIDLERANYMFSLTYNLLPEVFQSYFTKPSHNYQTRYSQNNYCVAPYLSKRSESSIKVIGPRAWEKIPENIKMLPFRKTFSKKLKQFYISELPTEKRTKDLHFGPKKVSRTTLKDIFDSSGEDATFLGFDLCPSLSTIFNESDEEFSFLGFVNTSNIVHEKL